MEDFFNIKQNKCEKCRIKKDNIVNFKDNAFVAQNGNADILILLDMYDYDETIQKFIFFLKNKNLEDFQIYSTTQCRSKNLEIPSPIYSVYNHCNCFNFNNLQHKPKVIIAVGRSIFYFLQDNDFSDWRDFSEYFFNPTYFYYQGIRVYPIPSLHEWIGGNSFQYAFTIKQFTFIKEYLKLHIEEKFNSYNIVKVENVNEFLKEYSSYSGYMSFDIETNGLEIYKDNFKIGCFTISFDGITGYYIPVENINKRLLSIFFQNKKIITANGKFDAKAVLKIFGIKIKIEEDIVLLAHILNTFRTKNGLKTLAWFVNLGGYDKDLSIYFKKYKCNSYLEIPENILINYATLDAIVTYRVFDFLKNILVPKQNELYNIYKEYLIPVLNIFIDVENKGILIDKIYVETLQRELKEKLESCKQKIFTYFNYQFDLNSPKQLGEMLEKKGLPCLEKAKAGYYKTGIDQLLTWKKMGYNVAEDIMQYREISKLLQAFVGEDDTSGLLSYISNDNKIHANFGIAMTQSLRSNCSDPNLQQIPKNEMIRKMFIPLNDYVFMEADYSGFQLRIATIYSKDDTMIDIFKNKNGDIHSITAQQVFCRDISIDEFLKKKKEKPFIDYRFKAKGINFGFLFGLSAEGFKSVIENDWNDKDVDEFIEKNKLKIVINYNNEEDKYLTVAHYIRETFFNTYSKLLQWIQNSKYIAYNKGYIDCPLGGRRHLPLLSFYKYASKINNKEKNHLENIAVNSPVQTFEAIMMYKAIINIYSEIKNKNLKSYIVGMVHDSLVLYVHKDEVSIMKDIIKGNMEDLYSFDVPITIEIQVGNVWGFGKEI
ncbi:MAG TPA: DNA polymerase [Candidatus Diapherotrites archaeon]|nr:DNA polymerase [Candidatus Diapherotrites archaeon]